VADDALLKTYRGGLRPERWGKYGDCFSVTVDRAVSLADFLMCDRYERTRSWFRVVPLDGGGTRLQFGSAVAAARDDQAGARAPGGTFRLLLGFHVLYSQALLRAAKGAVAKAPVVG
jgi:hypothetical protein